MLNEFKQYLLGIGKSENTALNYCDKVKLYFKWCLDTKICHDIRQPDPQFKYFL